MSVDALDRQAEEQCLADSPPSVVKLVIKDHFDVLTEQQKLYAHHISRAAFNGTRIVLRQVSPESETVYDIIISLYKSCSGNWQKLQKEAGLSDQELQHFLEYAAQFLGNNGNYKGFGDSKIVPRLSAEKFESLVATVPEAKELYHRLVSTSTNRIYLDKNNPGFMLLGFLDAGHVSGYYPDSPKITKQDIESVNEFMASQEILPENTRLRMSKDGSGYELLIASSHGDPPADSIDSKDAAKEFSLDGKLGGKKLKLIYGDHSEEMTKIAHHMQMAGKHAANGNQEEMMKGYSKSFATGSLKAFKGCQERWVKDIGPTVESNIGFIESYRDPAGVRSEWEGFVAMVNQERTRAFGKLVAAAPGMIPKLPWSKDFETDTFVPPDFTSLEVLSFATSGIPAGINIPNYDDIRRDVGFKNVSLGNVLGAKAPNEAIPFIHSSDIELYQEYRDAAFEVQVGIHELLGHGSGKLLQEVSPGNFNFDHSNPPYSPVTNAPVKTYYKPGQTWSSVFGTISSSYEECRAECIAMALACEFSILEIFGHGDGSEDFSGPAGDVLYCSYLSMARAGVAALEFWDPKARKWGQSHMQARFSILQTFLRAGEGFASLKYEDANLSDLTVHITRGKIGTVGRKAVEAYLQKLHIYKATADVDAGRALYLEMTEVDEWWATKVRPAVLAKKTPRKVFVQANTSVKEGKVVLKEYETTLQGMVQSFAEREV